MSRITTPTTTERVTLKTNYGSRAAVVIAQKWPNGDCWISARQMRDAERRAGVCQGDLVHLGGGPREGYLVKQS
jgi:hypothetical protein